MCIAEVCFGTYLQHRAQSVTLLRSKYRHCTVFQQSLEQWDCGSAYYVLHPLYANNRACDGLAGLHIFQAFKSSTYVVGIYDVAQPNTSV